MRYVENSTLKLNEYDSIVMRYNISEDSFLYDKSDRFIRFYVKSIEAIGLTFGIFLGIGFFVLLGLCC